MRETRRADREVPGEEQLERIDRPAGDEQPFGGLEVVEDLRDVEQDAIANKKTLPVRFGKSFARIEIILLYFVTFSLSTYWIWQERWLSGLLPLMILPLARRVPATRRQGLQM